MEKESYNEQKLIKILEPELSKPQPDWPNCLKLLKNLGYLRRQSSSEKDVDDSTYNTMFGFISIALEKNESAKVPLAVRIICIKILLNAAMTLFAKQHNTTASVAYGLIVSKISTEVARDNPSISFIISILDAIYQCAKAGYCNDKETIKQLLTLKNIVNKLTPCGMESLSIALDLDLEPFIKSYKFGSNAREMNSILSSLRCTKMIPDSQSIVSVAPIPPQNVTNYAAQIAAQQFLNQLSAEQIAQLVLEGFKQFVPIPGYTPPNTIADLIQKLNEEPEIEVDPKTNKIETTVYMIEQALDKFTIRAQFTPLKMQAEYVAMLINSLDQNEEGFDECTGPATSAALQRASESITSFLPFFSNWAAFEFVRNSILRYQNLIYLIFQIMASSEASEDDNTFFTFVKQLPAIPEETYEMISKLCREHPAQSRNMLKSINDNLPLAGQKAFLDAILSLCIEPSESIHVTAIDIVRTVFYKIPEFAMIINDYCKQIIETAMTMPIENARNYVKLYFAILERNNSLLLNLLDVYGKALPEIQPLIRENLKHSIPRIPFNLEVLEKALQISSKENKNIVLLHYYLDQLAKSLSVLPAELVELLKHEFQKKKDPYFLIPILSSLPADEAIRFLPDILTLKPNGLKAAIANLLTVKLKSSQINVKSLKPEVFLIELHKIPEKSPVFNAAITAIGICFEKKDIFTYQKSISAVETVIRQDLLDLVVQTLLKMVDSYKESTKYICMHLLSQLITKDVYANPRQWELFQQLLFKTKPQSLKPALQALPVEKISEFVKNYPAIKDLLYNTAVSTKNIKSQILEVLMPDNKQTEDKEKEETTEQNQEPEASKEEEKPSAPVETSA